MTKVYLLTGSNIGNSQEHLMKVKTFIQDQIGVLVSYSSIYKTEPWGNKNQQDFLNQVLEIETVLTPQDLLVEILSIEKTMGRNRLSKWEPRVIDIDILFYGSLILDTPDLNIPHPLLHERRFTLLPLHEIAPEFIHPLFQLPIFSLLKNCADPGLVEKM